MAFKSIIIDYQSKNLTTGLADVKAQIYKNGSGTAAATNIALAELNSSSAPGNYTLSISSANLVSWGFANGDSLVAVIDSASKPAQAVAKSVVTSNYSDDLESHLGTQDTNIAAIKTELDTVNTNVSAIKADVEDGSTGLAAIKAAIVSLSSQVASIQNNTSFEAFIPEGGLIKPVSGSTVYRIPINIQNEQGAVADADSNSIVVSLANVSGTDRGSILTGYSAGSAPAVRDAVGKYHIDLTLPSSATEEEIVFSFVYAISSAAYNKQRASLVVNNVQADGLALQTTLLAVKADVEDGTTGLSAIKSAINTANASLSDGTNGLAAIKAQGVSNGSAIASLQSDVTNNVEGSGFDNSTDSLRAMGVFLRANLYFGGKAV